MPCLYNVVFLVLMGSVCSIQAKHDDLTRLAVKWGTDKGPLAHLYTPIYSRYFSPLRQQPIKFLEIGFLAGASAHMWEEYFPHATLHFIENNLMCIDTWWRGFSSRSHIHCADQGNVSELQAFIDQAGGDFDIIVDDGGHTMEQQIISLQTLFPHLKSGGIYVIEDLHTSYWKAYGGGNGSRERDTVAGPQTTVHFLKNLIDDVNFGGAQSGYAAKDKWSKDAALTYYQDTILSMHFYCSLCFIIKR